SAVQEGATRDAAGLDLARERDRIPALGMELTLPQAAGHPPPVGPLARRLGRSLARRPGHGRLVHRLLEARCGRHDVSPRADGSALGLCAGATDLTRRAGGTGDRRAGRGRAPSQERTQARSRCAYSEASAILAWPG